MGKPAIVEAFEHVIWGALFNIYLGQSAGSELDKLFHVWGKFFGPRVAEEGHYVAEWFVKRKCLTIMCVDLSMVLIKDGYDWQRLSRRMAAILKRWDLPARTTKKVKLVPNLPQKWSRNMMRALILRHLMRPPEKFRSYWLLAWLTEIQTGLR